MAGERQKQSRRIITSFMLRFVQEAEDGDEEGLPELDRPEQIEPAAENNRLAGWRGVIKHIQSGAEHHFTTLSEAENFIKSYIEK
jgi:hypothetical protein